MMNVPPGGFRIELSDVYGKLVFNAWAGKLSNPALIVLLILAREVKPNSVPDDFVCLMYAASHDDSDGCEVYLAPERSNIARVFAGTPEDQRQQFSDGVKELILKRALILIGSDEPARRFKINFSGHRG